MVVIAVRVLGRRGGRWVVVQSVGEPAGPRDLGSFPTSCQ